jgi:hypothetical protein
VALKVYPVEPAVIFGEVIGFFKSSPCAAIIEIDEKLNTNAAIIARTLRYIYPNSLT